MAANQWDQDWENDIPDADDIVVEQDIAQHEITTVLMSQDPVLMTIHELLDGLLQRSQRHKRQLAREQLITTRLRQQLANSVQTVQQRNHRITELRARIHDLEDADTARLNTLRRLLVEVNGNCDRQTLREILVAALGENTPERPQRVLGQTRGHWRDHVELYLGQEVNSFSWSEIYKLSCRQSNIDAHPGMVHPHLRLRPPRTSELPPTTPEPEDEDTSMTQPSQDGDGNTSVPSPSQSFDFQALPREIRLMIFEKLFVFPGQVVHVLSRLDPFQPVLERRELEDREGRLQLLHRFHIGQKSCSLTHAIKPNELLAPLLVSKRWCYVGVHLFYGNNSFSASSLSEWGRFAKGIGHRVQRLRHLELLWKGSQMLVNEKTSSGKYVSKRTQPLLRIPQAIRLQTLEVYIQESSRRVMRRPHEPRAVIRYQKDLTHRHANFRLFRGMRNLQGIDNLYCLRGLTWIRFFDFDVWLSSKTKQVIRDTSFLSDINSTARICHSPEEARSRRFNMLKPVPRNYDPTSDDLMLVSRALRECHVPPSDELPTPSPSPTPDADDEDSDDGSDDDNDGSQSSRSDSDDSGGAGAVPPARPVMHVPPTPDSTAPSPGLDGDFDMGDYTDDEEEDDDSSDDGNGDDNRDGRDHGGGHIPITPHHDAEVKAETDTIPGISCAFSARVVLDPEENDDDEVEITGTRAIVVDLTRGNNHEEAIVVGEEQIEGSGEEDEEDEEEDEEDEEEGAESEEEDEGDEQHEESEENEGEASDIACSGEEESLFVEDNLLETISPSPSPPHMGDSDTARPPEPHTPLPQGPRFGTGPRDPAAGSSTSPEDRHSVDLFVSPPSQDTTVGGATSPEAAVPQNYSPGIFETPPRSGDTSAAPTGFEPPLFLGGSASNSTSPASTSAASTTSYGINIFETTPRSRLSRGGDGSSAGSNRDTPILIDEGLNDNPPVRPTPLRTARGQTFPVSTSPAAEMLRRMTVSPRMNNQSNSPRSDRASTAGGDPNIVGQRDPHLLSPYWRVERDATGSASPKRDRERDTEMGHPDETSPKRPRNSEEDREDPAEDEDASME